jgi:hypothetical protein
VYVILDARKEGITMSGRGGWQASLRKAVADIDEYLGPPQEAPLPDRVAMTDTKIAVEQALEQIAEPKADLKACSAFLGTALKTINRYLKNPRIPDAAKIVLKENIAPEVVKVQREIDHWIETP